MYFDELDISDELLDALDAMNFEKCSPIQEQAIPKILEGHDLMGIAQTGTGKTAAYLLPVLDELSQGNYPKDSVNCIIMSPTRELAQQIDQQVQGFAYYLDGVSSVAVYGGNDGARFEQERKGLELGADIIIATPGRLISHLNGGHIDFKKTSFFILDEADRMLDMGFLPSVKKIVAATPKSRQTLLFSATIDRSIEKVAGSFLRDPAIVEIAHKGETADTVEQYIVRVPQTLKNDLLRATIASWGSERVIVFARTRSRADSTCRRLKRAGYKVEAIHSSRSQNQRRRALENFESGETDILVATDVLARGIDVDEVNYVVNLDLPTQAEDYVHRIGRTGRAGATGRAISFVTPETEDALRDIEKFTKREIPEVKIEGFDEEAAAVAAAERATKAAARKDPDIAEAKREMAKREKKKKKAQARAAEEREAAQSGKKTKKGKPSKSSAKGSQTAGRAGAPSRRSENAKGNSTGKKRTQGKKRAQESSSAPTKKGSKKDFRPGRAHRAEVARLERKHRS